MNGHTGKTQTVGYIRVSSADQNDVRQLEGLTVDRRFVDQASGATTNRPELARLIAYVREGDAVLIHSMDRLARNVDDLRRLVAELTGRGVRVQFVREGLTFTGDDAPMAQLLLSTLGAVAQFERDLIRERQREGIAAAKSRGVYKGRPPALTAEQRAAVRSRAAAGESPSKIAREFGITRQSVYRYASKDA